MTPCLFNDRMLLGLKGTLSEAELHFLKARLALRPPRQRPLTLGPACHQGIGPR